MSSCRSDSDNSTVGTLFFLQVEGFGFECVEPQVVDGGEGGGEDVSIVVCVF